MVPTSAASILEENIDRVVDSVVRNVSAGRGAVPNLDTMQADVVEDDRGEDRETLADLCHALKSLDSAPHVLASYRAPEAPASPPTLNLIR